MKYHADMFLSTCVLLVVAILFTVVWRGTSPSSGIQQSKSDTDGDHHPQALLSPPEAETESAQRPAARQAVEPEVLVDVSPFPVPTPGPWVSPLLARTDDLAKYVRDDLPKALRATVEAMDESTLERFLQGAHGVVQRYNERRDEYWRRMPQMTDDEFLADATLELARVRLEQELRDLIE